MNTAIVFIIQEFPGLEVQEMSVGNNRPLHKTPPCSTVLYLSLNL